MTRWAGSEDKRRAFRSGGGFSDHQDRQGTGCESPEIN